MAAPVVKTLCGNLPQHPSPEPFTTPTHNYYKAIGDTATTHHYLWSEATEYYTNITKADRPDITVSNGGVVIPSLQAIGDTATTHPFLESEATNYCTNITNVDGPDITVSNGGVVIPSLQAKVTLSKELSNKAQPAFILDKLKTGSLLSISQLCNDDCIAIFNKFNVNILKKQDRHH